MNDDKPSTIPFNSEHLEAVQEKINKEREAVKAAMPPEEAAIVTRAEEFSQSLADSCVPHVLYLDTFRDGRGCFRFQFPFSRKFEDKCSPEALENLSRNVWNLNREMTLFLSYQFRVVLYDKKSGKVVCDTQKEN